MRSRTLLSVALVLVAGMAFANGAQEGAAEPIRMGGVWPLGDITGEQGSKSAQLAVDELNANGGNPGSTR